MACGITYWSSLRVVASRELPLGTVVLLRYGVLEVEAIVLDRGPYVDRRHIDLSHALACRLGVVRQGVQRIEVEILGYCPKKFWRAYCDQKW
jgi:rare lipoprotein A